MNRIRHAYLELAPEFEPYFVTSRYDDDAGVLQSALATRGPMPRTQPFVAIPGVIAMLGAVVAGAVAGIAGLGIGGSIAVGAAAFLITVAPFGAWARRMIASFRDLDVRFPTPPQTDERGN